MSKQFKCCLWVSDTSGMVIRTTGSTDIALVNEVYEKIACPTDSLIILTLIES